MRSAVAAISLIALFVVGFVAVPRGASQDRNDGRLAALETRVAVLETAVATSPPVASISDDETFTLTGTLVLVADADSISTLGGVCKGEGGYSDMREGAPVTVTNETGATVGLGALGTGSPTGSTRCVFSFVVIDIPRAQFYTIDIAGRGGLAYSFDELDSRGWVVEFSLGD